MTPTKTAWLLLASVLQCGLASAQSLDQAADDVQFDRPGLSFSAWSLPRGGVVWEQGLPDASWQRDNGTRIFEGDADSRLRFGLGRGVELQLAATPYAWQSSHGADASRAHGQGDSDLALKWTLPLSSQDWSMALLATHKVATGGQPFGSPGRADQLAAAINRDLGNGRSIGAYLARDYQHDGHGWMSAASYGFPLGDVVSGYVETGWGNGVDHARVAGGGVTMLLRHRVQLDSWVLRGLDRGSPDWQAGFGVSVVLARGH